MIKLISTTTLMMGLLLGCEARPEKTQGTSNKDATVEVMFTDADGYTIKKFTGASSPQYYVTGGCSCCNKMLKSQPPPSPPVVVGG